MSLILDALKKSEAERRRGQPPSLHAQFGAPRRTRRTPWVAGAGAVLLVAGLSGGWMWLARDRGSGAVASGAQLAASDTQGAAQPTTVAAVEPTMTAASPALIATAEAPPAAASHAAGESAFGGVSGDGNGGSVSGGGLPVPQRAGLYTPTATLPPPTTVAAPPPVSPPAAQAPPPQSPPPPVAPAVAATHDSVKPEPAPVAAANPPTVAPMVEPAAPSIAIATAAAPPSADPARPEEVLPTIYQLPYTTRKDLPKLELSMHVYSPVPAERFVVLNGKRFMLDSPAPGPELTLVDIVTDGAVLEFRGQRFLLPRQSY